MHQAERKKPDTLSVIKRINISIHMRRDGLTRWITEAPDDVLSAHARAVTRLNPIQDQDYLFAASLSIHYALGPMFTPLNRSDE